MSAVVSTATQFLTTALAQSPLLRMTAHLKHLGHVEAVTYRQDDWELFEPATTFVRLRAPYPPRTSLRHRPAIDKALECKRKNRERMTAFNFSGHGFPDLAAP